MRELIHTLAKGGYEIGEQVMQASREASYSPIPKKLFDSRMGVSLSRAGFKQLWKHQTRAIELLCEGRNVVVSTATASGKSLIFRTYAFHLLVRNHEARVVVFYPLKALANDQLNGWREFAQKVGLNVEFVQRIDGSVPIAERDAMLRAARVLLVTPDVFHAWMMANISMPIIQEFVKSLQLVVVDEAHTLESVFGSNFAYLLRRTTVARKILARNKEDIQVMAATATINQPGNFMSQLTGLEFDVVDELEDGSAQSARTILHIIPKRGDENRAAVELHRALMDSVGVSPFLTFVDSRKKVENLVANLQKNNSDRRVLPYRSGYESSDRIAIERELKAGSIAGVISTSALEMGIDFPNIRVGINIDLPDNIKSLRQRIGRIGRGAEGIFIIMACSDAFSKFGTTLSEALHAPVEPTYLYLENRFMQYANARCMLDEFEGLGISDKRSTLRMASWPSGFSETFEIADGPRPAEFDAIAQVAGQKPHFGYPLRNVGELSFKIKLHETAESIGEINLAQALRECYPGATYLHMARPYRVESWSANFGSPWIRVRPCANIPTRPRLRTWVNTSLLASDILGNNYRSCESGYITECRMQVTQKVEGFSEGNGPFRHYRDLRRDHPAWRSQMRDFRTTGVLIYIEADWFSEAVRRAFVVAHLRSIFCRVWGVASKDVGVAATNIWTTTSSGTARSRNCIVLYDDTYGSLRITERIYSCLSELSERFQKFAESIYTSATREEAKSIAAKLHEFLQDAEESQFSGCAIAQKISEAGQYLRVYSAGSCVAIRDKGPLLSEVTVSRPAMLNGELWYEIESLQQGTAAPVRQYVPAGKLEQPAQSKIFHTRYGIQCPRGTSLRKSTWTWK